MMISAMTSQKSIVLALMVLVQSKAEVVKQIGRPFEYGVNGGPENIRPGSVNDRPGFQSGISCFYLPPGGYQETRTQCSSSSGCMKRILYQENGRELEEKGCGLYEGSNYEYNDGCETRHVPFKSKECYCKSSLCNGAEMMPVGSLLTLIIPIIILHINYN